MGRTVYVNGRFVDESDACISIFDRGFLFADAVYEVTSVIGGQLIDQPAHLERLARSLAELRIAAPASDDEITAIQRRLVEANGVDEGIVYLQVSRGSADRDFAFPRTTTPSLVGFTQARKLLGSPAVANGIRVVTVPDLRWRRCDIKTTSLLAASMAKQQALERGADDAWMHLDGIVTEGSSNNAWIVTAAGEIVTRPLGPDILGGVTRRAIREICAKSDMTLVERPFTIAEAVGAREAFITSASVFVCGVVEIDGQTIGDGRPGPIARELYRLYLERVGRR